MNRTIGGLPLIYWIGALGLGIGAFVWIKKRGASTTSPGSAAKPGAANQFTQAQEVQDFQIFSALTGAQQASDLNMVSELAGLFSGGSSTGTTGGAVTGSGGGGTGGSAVPSPPSTGTAVPTTIPASAAAAGTAVTPASSEPGYGSGLAALLAANPGLLDANSGGKAVPGITGYNASYNGVPL